MKTTAFGLLSLLVTVCNPAGRGASPADLAASVGQPADIAPSAYLYRADRKPAENAPESWLALMRYAGQPLDRPVDGDAPAIRRALVALLWEEIRPIQRVELTWTGPGGSRRGLKTSLRYLGTSKWRRVQPFTSQPDDVARTLVTVWTRSGNFSFLAGDLENGPILAPEYGFFVRRTSAVVSRPTSESALERRPPLRPLVEKMQAIAGNDALLGWDSDATPWLGGNPTECPQTAQGIALPARSFAMHPGSDRDVAVGWCSPVKAAVRVHASVAHAQQGGNGIE